MSGSLNIYPFEDTVTTIRFVVQICVFLIGLTVTNKMIIQPSLRLQAERKKRTAGNQEIAQNMLKDANELEHAYHTRFNEALEKSRDISASQIKQAKESAAVILLEAQKNSQDYLAQVKFSLTKEKEEAASHIHLYISNIVSDIYSKFGVNA